MIPDMQSMRGLLYCRLTVNETFDFAARCLGAGTKKGENRMMHVSALPLDVTALQ